MGLEMEMGLDVTTRMPPEPTVVGVKGPAACVGAGVAAAASWVG